MNLPQTMSRLAATISAAINPRGGTSYGFVLMVFPASHQVKERNCHYIANVSGAKIREILEEQVRRMPDYIGRANSLAKRADVVVADRSE